MGQVAWIKAHQLPRLGCTLEKRPEFSSFVLLHSLVSILSFSFLHYTQQFHSPSKVDQAMVMVCLKQSARSYSNSCLQYIGRVYWRLSLNSNSYHGWCFALGKILAKCSLALGMLSWGTCNVSSAAACWTPSDLNPAYGIRVSLWKLGIISRGAC